MFDLLKELEKRQSAIANNDALKEEVAQKEKELDALKAEVLSDEDIEKVCQECDQIKDYCIRLGLIALPIVEEVVEETPIAVVDDKPVEEVAPIEE